MSDKKPKRPRDRNLLAKSIIDIASGAVEEGDIEVNTSAQKKGGKKGGLARAASMTPEEREDMAKLAAEARWKKRQAASPSPNRRSSISSLKSNSIWIGGSSS